MCFPTQAEAKHFFFTRNLRMLMKSLTYEQRKKNTIFVRYFLVAKPEKKINQKKSMFSSFSLEE